METDKIPQETPTAQPPLENEPVHKNLLNQKGSFLLILGAVVIILVVLGVGAYYLGTQKSKPTEYQNQPSTSQYSPTATTTPAKMLGSKYQYILIQKTVKISDENIIKAFYQDNPNVTVNAAIERTGPNTNQKEIVVKPLSDKLLGEMIAPSGCCAKKYDILQHQVIQNDSYLLFIRDKLYIVDLNTKLVSQMPTNYPAYALEFRVSPDERYVFLKSGDRHSSTYQEVIDLSNKTLYKLPDYSVGFEIFSVFEGFEGGKVIIAERTSFEQKNPSKKMIDLITYPSKSFDFNFASQ